MEPTPERWGLRGDPFFWEELRRHFDKIPMPYDEWNLHTFLNRIELCVGVSQMEKRTIRFVTFMGIAYVMDVYSFEILETHMTK